MLGHISFHHKAPDPDLLEYSERGAELGYTIEPEYRRHGYDRESAISMMEWAGREHGGASSTPLPAIGHPSSYCKAYTP